MGQVQRIAVVLLSVGVLLSASTYALSTAWASGSTTVSRAQFVEDLARAAHLQPVYPSQPTFVDVGSSSPYYGYVEAAFKSGWISGVNATHFDPTGPLTRAQIAKIEVIALGDGAATLSQMSSPTSFTDDSAIPTWARGYIVEAVQLGLVKGYPDDSFRPDTEITTAQVAAFLSEFTAVASVLPAIKWQSIGPKGFANDLAPESTTMGLNGAGKIGTVAVDESDPQIMYAGAAGGDARGPLSEAGVLKTMNGGETWVPESDGLSNTQVNALWIDEASPSTLLAATEGGIFRTTDGGAKWEMVSRHEAIGFASAGSALYAGTDAGVAESKDFGLSWRIVYPTAYFVNAIAASGTVIYVAAGPTVLSGSGWTWTALPSLPQSDGVSWVTADPKNPSTVYMAVCVVPSSGGACTREVLKSIDGGHAWSRLDLPTTYVQGLFVAQALAIDPSQPGTVYVGGNSAFSVSTDGGTTFTQMPVNLDIWSLTPWKNHAGTLLAGTDQGLFLVSDDGKQWRSLNGDLSTSLLYDVAVQGSTIFASVQDYSPFYSFDGGNSWASQATPQSPNGEGGEVIFDPADPSVVLVMGGCCGLQVSIDGGHTFEKVPNLNGIEYNQDPQGIAFGAAGQIYVAAANGVYESSDNGKTFSATDWPIAHPSFVAMSPSGAIYVGDETSQPSPIAGYANSGTLMYSTDGGSTWHQSDLGSAHGYPVSIAWSPVDPSNALLGMSFGPQDGGGVLKSSDGGKSFVLDNAGIANIARYWAGQAYPAIWQISYAPGTGIAVAATSNGLYILRPHASTWIAIRANAGPFMFTGIAWANGDIYVSTMGEGVLEAPISSLSAP